MINRKSRVDTMGIFEKQLVMYVLKFIFRWLMSNEKNTKAREVLKKKDSE